MTSVRNTLIAFVLMTCAADVGSAQTLLDTTIVHGIGAKSCSEYLSAVSDHAPGTGLTVKQADVDYFDAATVQSEWLAGFMTAMNMVWSEPTMQITAGAAAIDDWIRTWCERHPTQVLVHAAAAFAREQFLTQLSK
jgi:hypothetical protein